MRHQVSLLQTEVTSQNMERTCTGTTMQGGAHTARGVSLTTNVRFVISTAMEPTYVIKQTVVTIPETILAEEMINMTMTMGEGPEDIGMITLTIIVHPQRITPIL